MAVSQFLYPSGGAPLGPPSQALRWLADAAPPALRRSSFAAIVTALSAWPPQNVPQSPANSAPGWWQGLHPEAFRTPFPVASQQYDAIGRQGNIPSPVHKDGWRNIQLDYAFARPFPAASQQFPTSFQVRGDIFSSYPNGWHCYKFNYLFAKPFPVALQQYAPALQPRGFVPSSFPEGWEAGFQLDYKFAKPVPAAVQQYAAFQPRGFILITTPDGWRNYQLDTAFAKKFPAPSQQFTTTFRGRIPPPDGWAGIQLESRFRKPIASALHPYTTWPIPQRFEVGLGWWGYQYEYRYKTPFPAAQQQFGYFQPRGDIPIILPPGAGRRKDFPSYIPQPPYDAKPNRKFHRPVWDKPPPAPVEEPAPPPPVAGLPPPELFGLKTAPSDKPLILRDFKELAPPDPRGFDQHMREVQDQSDAIAVLRALGLIKE